MADFNFNIKLGVDDSEVMKSIRRLDAESKRVASGSSTQVPSAPPVQQNLSRVNTADRNAGARDAGRIAAANAQVQKQQAKALGLDAPSLNKIRAASVDSFKASFKGFDLLPKSQQTAIVKRFSKSFDTFFADFERQLSKIKPTRIGTAVRDLYNREVQAVVGAKASQAKTVPAKTLVRQAEAAATPAPRAPSAAERRASTARATSQASTTRRTRRQRPTADFAPEDLVGPEAEVGAGQYLVDPYRGVTKQNARTDRYGRPVGRSSAVAKGRSLEERLQAQLERGQVRRELEPTFKKLLTKDFLGSFEDPRSAKAVNRGLKKTLVQFPGLAPSQLGTFSRGQTRIFGRGLPTGMGGWAFPNMNGVALRKDMDPADTMRILMHELGHIGDYKTSDIYDPKTGMSARDRIKQRLKARGADIYGPLRDRQPESVIGLGTAAENLRVKASETKSGTLSLREVQRIAGTGSIRGIEDLKDFVASQNALAKKKTGLATGPLSVTPSGKLKALTLQEYLGRDNPLYKSAAKQRATLQAGTSQYGTKNLFETIAEAIALRTGIPLGAGQGTLAGDVAGPILGNEIIQPGGDKLSVDELNAQLDRLAASLRETVAQITGAEGEVPRVTGPKASGPSGATGPARTTGATTGPAKATGPTTPKATGPTTATGPKATGPKSTGPKTTGATTGSTRGSGSRGIDKAEKDLVKSLDNKSKALDRQTDVLKKIYADFAKAERALVSSLTSKGATAKKVASAMATGGGGGGGGGSLDDLLDGEEERLSPYEAAARDAANRRASMEDIGDNVQAGDPEELVQNSGIAEAYRQYVDALIEAAAAIQRENLGLVNEIAKARAQVSLYDQKLANQVLALQNADPAFIAGAAQGQVLKAQQAAAVGATAQANYGPQLGAAAATTALTNREKALAKLRQGLAQGVDPSIVGTRQNRILLARQEAAKSLARGDEQAIAAERKRQVAQIKEGVKAAVQLDPKEALAALAGIQKQLSALQNDIADDIDITINDDAATAVLQALGKKTDEIQKKIVELQNIGKTAPQNLPTALDTPKDTTSKDLRDLKRRANLIRSNVKDATALYDTDPKASRQALRSSEAAIKDLKKERKQLANSVGGVKNLTSQQKVEYDSLTLAIRRVVDAQKQLNNPNTINAASRAAKLRAEIRKEQTLLGEISKEKDPAKRAAQLKDLDDRVKKLAAQKLNIDTSVDPQAQIELDRLDTQIGILNSKRIAVASGAVVGGGGGAGGGGGRVAGAAGAAGRGGQRGDIVSRVRGLGGAAGFFGSGALSTLRYSIPSAILFGAATGIASSIKEAEQLQFNLAKIESQIQSTFGEDAAAVTQQFKQQIMDVSLETGLAADELALLTVQLIGAFSTVGNIEGLSGVELVNAQIDSAAKIAQSTGLPLAEITDGLTAASIAFGASFQKIGDVALGLEQKSGVLAKETISFIGDIAPVAKEAGFSLEEFSAIAVIAQQRSGRGGAALAEQFGRIIPAVYQSRQALLDIAVTNTALGTPEFFTAINNSDTRGILFGIGKAFNSLNKESKDFIVNLLGGRREAAAILPALSNPQALQGLTKAADNSAGKLEERFKKVQATLTNTFQRLNEQVRKLFLTLLESGLEDLLKEIAGLLGIIAKGFGIVFKAISPVLGAFDGLPVKILAAVAAFKLLKAATKFGPGGGLAALGSGLNPANNNNFLSNMRANALQRQAAMGTISPAQRAQAAAVFNAMAGYGLPGYGNVKPYGLNPKTGTYPAPGMLGGSNVSLTGRQAYADARAGGAGRLSALGAGITQRRENVAKLNKAGLQTPGQSAAGLFGGAPGLALTGAFIAYGILQDRFDKERAELDKLNAFAKDANTSIAELRAKAVDLRETNAGIGFATQLAGFFTGQRYESAAEYAESLVFAKEAFDDGQKRIIDILSTQGDVVTLFLEQSAKIKSPRYFKQPTDDGNLRGISDYQIRDIIKARDKAVLETGPNKGKIDVRRYIRNRYGSDVAVRQGQTLGESDIFQAEKVAAEQGSEISKAVVERVNKLAEVAGVATDDLYTSVFDALGTSNPVAKLNEIAQDDSGKYGDEVQAQAAKVANEIGAKSKDDPRVKAILEANGLLDDAAAATLKSVEQLQKDLDIGRVAPSTYLSGLDKLIQSTLTAISKSSGNQKVLYESLLNLLKLRNDFINSQAQQTLTSVLDVLNVTTDQTTVSGITQKAAAIQAAINSGLTGEDLRKAALDLVQTQQDLAIALIQNADTSEEAFAIASKPIKIPIETRIAAIKGRLQALVGNWSTFTQGWETAFGETADAFITFITTGLDNGSLSIDQVKAILEEKKKQLELQKQAYNSARAYIGARDEAGNLVPDQTSQAYDQAIAGTDAIIDSINTTGQLPGDTGSEINNKKAFFQAAQQRSQAATNLAKSKANKNSVAKAVLDAAQAEDEYQKAVALGLDDQTLDDLDAKRREAKQAVIDAAKAVADAVRGIARAQAAANKDSVAQATADIEQANADLQAAIAADDKEGIANAEAAIIAGKAAKRDAVNNRRRLTAQLRKAQGSQDSVDQAAFDVDIAKLNLATAVGPEERMQAMIDLLAAEKAQKDVIKRRREALAELAKAQTEDPVEDANIDLALAQKLLQEAVTMDDKIAAQKQLIEAQKAITNAMNDVRNSQYNLRQAELSAIGDDIGAAQVAAEAARAQLQQAIAAGKGTAEINNLRVGVINADKAARDSLFQGKLDDYRFLYDMGKLTKFQYIQYLEGLKSTLIPGTKQFKDLELTIKGLKDDIGQDLQFNLPTALSLPTLYEVRRLNQSGPGGSFGAPAAQNTYAPSVVVNVGNVNNGVDADNMIQAIRDVVDPSRNGYGPRRY